ncbi:MAG: iron-sulfur cluster carrier protein ApbC, partial [Hyphomicrobiales bacterium]
QGGNGAHAGAPAGRRTSPPPGAGPGAVPPPMAGRAGPQGGPQGGPRQIAGVPGVKNIVAVASGKGGVGKSTTAVNLALAFQANGLKVGVLDADIYGPSMPRLLGITGRPQPVQGNVLKPMEGYGLKVMSMGFLVEEDTPMIWRGPMVMSALTQMLKEVAWGELDLLVVDMPPGTGDAQLTMAQQVPLAGAVIVSTPQDLALIDARKGLNMFRKTDVPVLGIVENMSYFLCPSCGTRSDIFGHGGARHEAEKLGVPFLGEVPLHMDIREKSDAGQPVVVSEPEGPHAAIYRDIAKKAWAEIERHKAGTRAAPSIVIES